MKIPPFIANTPDDMHCVNAVFRMVYKHYFGKDISWDEIDALTKAEPDKGTWTFLGMTEFAKKGMRIRHIEPLDYAKLYNLGEKYLYEVFGKETADYYINKSNIASVIKYIPEYLKLVNHKNRKATIQDITQALHEGALVGAEINSRILNDKPGFSLHFVLIYGFDERSFTLHDPGLPPIEARRITIADFEKCFNYPGANNTITVFAKE